jgi:hypothetical protein
VPVIAPGCPRIDDRGAGRLLALGIDFARSKAL